MARKATGSIPVWRCPGCGDIQKQRALAVSHVCPKRVNQPAPEKGKRRLSDVVSYERFTSDDSDQVGTADVG